MWSIISHLVGVTPPMGASVNISDVTAAVGLPTSEVLDAIPRLAAYGVITPGASDALCIRRWSSSEVDNYFEVRACLFQVAAKKCAERLLPGKHGEMTRLLRALEANLHGDLIRFATCDRNFVRMVFHESEVLAMDGLAKPVLDLWAWAYNAIEDLSDGDGRLDRECIRTRRVRLAQCISAGDAAYAEATAREEVNWRC